MESGIAPKIAILEDQRLVRESLEELFLREGLAVAVTSEDPGDFLTRVAEHRPDVALVDLYLSRATPPAQGVEVIRSLMATQRELTVIALSGVASPDDLEQARLAGAAAVLDKNLTGPELLLSVVRSALRVRVVELPPSESPHQSPLSNITLREREVLRHVADGSDNLKIAAQLGITERTVRAHVSSLYRKLGCENRTQMALLAQRFGLSPSVRN